MATFKVLRQHLGDKLYLPGDEREAENIDVQHLVASGVLEAAGGAKAKGPAPENKAAAAAPETTSERGGQKPPSDTRARRS